MTKQISLDDIQDEGIFTAARIRQTVCQARDLVRANWITAKELWKRRQGLRGTVFFIDTDRPFISERIYRTLQA